MTEQEKLQKLILKTIPWVQAQGGQFYCGGYKGYDAVLDKRAYCPIFWAATMLQPICPPDNGEHACEIISSKLKINRSTMTKFMDAFDGYEVHENGFLEFSRHVRQMTGTLTPNERYQKNRKSQT